MGARDANVAYLRREISQCEARLKSLKDQLHDAETQELSELKQTKPGRANLESGSATTRPLDRSEYVRYGRQLIMPEIGLQGI